jgi:site-specific DNA-cytosine methylase
VNGTNLKEKLCNHLIKNNLVKESDVIRHSYSTSRMEKMYTQNSIDNNTAPTLDTRCDCLGVTVKDGIINGLRIRKLTPKECWRLMGFDDEAFEKAAKVNSNAQLYKQAGNSIVVNVLVAILKQLLNTDNERK